MMRERRTRRRRESYRRRDLKARNPPEGELTRLSDVTQCGGPDGTLCQSAMEQIYDFAMIPTVTLPQPGSHVRLTSCQSRSPGIRGHRGRYATLHDLSPPRTVTPEDGWSEDDLYHANAPPNQPSQPRFCVEPSDGAALNPGQKSRT